MRHYLVIMIIHTNAINKKNPIIYFTIQSHFNLINYRRLFFVFFNRNRHVNILIKRSNRKMIPNLYLNVELQAFRVHFTSSLKGTPFRGGGVAPSKKIDIFERSLYCKEKTLPEENVRD